MIRAIFLDIDDTLLSFDGYVREAMKSGFEAFGIAPFEEGMLSVFHQVNSELWHRIEAGELSFGELLKIRWNLVFQALGLQGDGEKFEAYFRDRLFYSAIPVEGAKELLDYLHGKYILCAASNGPYHQQANRLKEGRMLDFFDHLFISEEIGFSKPSREFFHACMQRLNEGRAEPISAKDVMVIGDSLSSDIAGGIGYGMQTVYFNPRQKEIPSEVKPNFTVGTLKEIEEIL